MYDLNALIIMIILLKSVSNICYLQFLEPKVSVFVILLETSTSFFKARFDLHHCTLSDQRLIIWEHTTSALQMHVNNILHISFLISYYYIQYILCCRNKRHNNCVSFVLFFFKYIASLIFGTIVCNAVEFI